MLLMYQFCSITVVIQGFRLNNIYFFISEEKYHAIAVDYKLYPYLQIGNHKLLFECPQLTRIRASEKGNLNSEGIWAVESKTICLGSNNVFVPPAPAFSKSVIVSYSDQ